MKKSTKHPRICLALANEYIKDKSNSRKLWLDMRQSYNKIERIVGKFINLYSDEYIICDFENFGKIKIDTDDSVSTVHGIVEYSQRYGLDFIETIYQHYPDLEDVLIILRGTWKMNALILMTLLLSYFKTTSLFPITMKDL